MGVPAKYDIGSLFAVLYGAAANTSGAPIIVVAGGAGDGVANVGATIDTQGYGSCKFVLAALAALTDAKTLSIAAEYQVSDNGSSWDTAVALQSSTQLLISSGGTNEYGQVEFDLSFHAERTQKRYIRFNFTPDLSHTSTDEALCLAMVCLGGKDTLPATGAA